MSRITRAPLVSLLCGVLLLVTQALAQQPAAPAPEATTKRPIDKIPTKISGDYRHGELVELRVRDRIAFLVKPTGVVDAKKRWLWDFPF